jgi:parallel beta-helix repeat protein
MKITLNGKILPRIQIAALFIFAMVLFMEPDTMQTERVPERRVLPSTSHAPFVIDGNSALISFPDKRGSGSVVDPYIIEDITIVQTESAPCICIKNTTLNLVIRNCTFSSIPLSSYSSDDAGITIEWSTNVTVENCLFYSLPSGIVSWMQSKNIKIFNNTCQDIWLRGIQLIGCANVSVEQNRVNMRQDYDHAISIGFNNYDVRLKKNNMTGSGIDFWLYGTNIANFSSFSIDSTNMVHGNPVYFYFNQTRLAVGNFSSAGQAILLNCNDSLISGLNVPTDSTGFSLLRSHNITFTNNVFASVPRGVFIGENSSDIAFNGNIFQGKWGIIASLVTSLHVNNNNFSDNAQYGIYVYNGINCTVIGNLLLGCGVYFSGSNTTQISRNTIINSTWGGLVVYSSNAFVISNNTITSVQDLDAIRVNWCNDTTIVQNTCMNNSEDGISVNIDFSSNVTVASNLCTSNARSGIAISGRTWVPGEVAIAVTNNSCAYNGNGCYLYYASFCLVTNNSFTDNTNGMVMETATSNTILDNQILRNGENGLSTTWNSSHNEIAKNTIALSGKEGIRISQSPSNNITNNIIAENAGGCSLVYSNSTVLAHNTVVGNTGFGIRVYLSDETILSGNNISSNTNEGILLEYADSCIISGNHVNHNVHGIYLDDANDNTISGNVFSSNMQSCIYVTAQSLGNRIHDNVLDGVCIIMEGDHPGADAGIVVTLVIALVGALAILFLLIKKRGQASQLKMPLANRTPDGVVNEVVYRRPDTSTPPVDVCPYCGKAVVNRLPGTTICSSCGHSLTANTSMGTK